MGGIGCQIGDDPNGLEPGPQRSRAQLMRCVQLLDLCPVLLVASIRIHQLSLQDTLHMSWNCPANLVASICIHQLSL